MVKKSSEGIQTMLHFQSVIFVVACLVKKIDSGHGTTWTSTWELVHEFMSDVTSFVGWTIAAVMWRLLWNSHSRLWTLKKPMLNPSYTYAAMHECRSSFSFLELRSATPRAYKWRASVEPTPTPHIAWCHSLICSSVVDGNVAIFPLD